MQVIINGVEHVPTHTVENSGRVTEALEYRFDSDAGESLSIRDYLYSLLHKLWSHGEGFSSKRPFGNSGWELDIYAALVAGGFVAGELDEDGYLEYCDNEEANKLVFDMIDVVFYGTKE
jgi:hypothetical protein